jgi:hypothetical protein
MQMNMKIHRTKSLLNPSPPLLEVSGSSSKGSADEAAEALASVKAALVGLLGSVEMAEWSLGSLEAATEAMEALGLMEAALMVVGALGPVLVGCQFGAGCPSLDARQIMLLAVAVGGL